MTFTRDLVRHGNVTLNVTYPISGSSADKSMIFVLFLTYFWSTKSPEHNSTQWHSRVTFYVTVHVTVNVTYPISGSSADKSMIIVVVSNYYFWSTKSSEYKPTPWHSRVTLYVTVKVTITVTLKVLSREFYGVDLSFRWLCWPKES